MEEYFQSQGCVFLEKTGRRVRYIATCGHEHTSCLDVFKTGSSRKCRQCTIDSLRSSENDYHIQEAESFVHISKHLEPILEVKRTHEGCLADFLVRPWGTNDDAWMQVQLKTTQKAVNGTAYIFSLHKRYPGCIILCHCISDERFWVFRDYELPEKCLGIRGAKSKYARNEVHQSDLSTMLKGLYDTTCHIPFDDAMIPVSQTQRIEYEYRLKREKFFNDVRFEYPTYEHRRYDFTVNGKKYQEKVATLKDGRYIFKSKYVLGDNDFYIVHIPDTDFWYCFPEDRLIENQNTSGCITINLTKHQKWYQPYRHTYTRRDFSF